jgi:exopolyphosphatase/pppGpp-phosphohydrolase
MPNTKREIRGCIDLGSSYFRLLVARACYPGGSSSAPTGRSNRAGVSNPSRSGHGAPRMFEVVAEDRIYVGWGEAIAGDGLLPASSIEDALGALRILVSKAGAFGCLDPLLIGTNTLREARNGTEAVRLLSDSLGKRRITVLTQRQEAALSYLGASTVLDRPEPTVLIDVGGTSTEIAWGLGSAMEDFRGIPFGTHGVRPIISRCGLHTSLTILRDRIRSRSPEGIDPLYVLPIGGEIPTILATGGTAVSLAVVLRLMKGEEPLVHERTPVSACEFGLAVRRIWALYAEGRERRLPLEEDRVTLLMPGLVLLAALVQAMDMPGFIVTPRDLRWGGIMAGDELADYATNGG